jgi:tRNA 2-thiouridine synthesizing protein E
MSTLDSGPRRTIHQVRTIHGKEVVFDEEGFLLEPELWDEELAEFLAREDGLPELGPKHWHVIRFLREYYFANGKSPLNAVLRKGTGLSLTEIEACFPKGIKQGARRLAGLPNPKGCA